MNILKSRKFWLAVAGLVLNIVAWLVPDIPTEVRASMSTVLTALITVLIGAHAYTDSKTSSAAIIGDAIKEAGRAAADPLPPSPRGQA